MSKVYYGIRGTASLDPSETNSFNSVIQKSRKIFQIYGYEEIILPLLEEQGVFSSGVGNTTDIVEKQMFKIEGKDIVLRPEGTAQVIRYYLEKALYKQSDFSKFSYVGPMFRGERPQKGRLRQFHHIGAEAVGSDSVYLDGEIISLSLAILEEVGVKDKTLKINTLGCASDKEKFSQYLREMLESRKDDFCQDCQRRLKKYPLRILDCKNKSCVKAIKTLRLGQTHLCEGCRKHFDRLRLLLDSLKIEYFYAPYLVRGLDYYTNTVFEITSESLGSQDAIGAGGRYNNLVKCLGGPDIPAIGFALGIERIFLVRQQQPPQNEKITVFIAALDETCKQEGFVLLQKIRAEGISSDTGYCDKSLKGQLRYAQKRGAKFVVIIGEEELKEHCVMLKNMEKTTQEKVSMDDIIKKLKSQT